MKNKKYQGLSILLTLPAVLSAFYAEAQTQLVPMPINQNYGTDPSTVVLSSFIAINIFCIIWLVARWCMIRESQHFSKQSAVKNFFYELKNFSDDEPSTNTPTMILITIYSIAILVLMTLSIVRLMG